MSGYIELNSDGWPQMDSMDSSKNTKIKGRYIATSLYNRLLPRWHYLHMNPNDIVKTPVIPILEESALSEAKEKCKVLPPLHLLAGASDQVFCDQMCISLQEYLQFKRAKAPQLKFNSQFEIWLQTGRPFSSINKELEVS